MLADLSVWCSSWVWMLFPCVRDRAQLFWLCFGIIGKLPTFCNVSQRFSFQRYFYRLCFRLLFELLLLLSPLPIPTQWPKDFICGGSPSVHLQRADFRELLSTLSSCNMLFHFPPNWNQPAGHSLHPLWLSRPVSSWNPPSSPVHSPSVPCPALSPSHRPPGQSSEDAATSPLYLSPWWLHRSPKSADRGLLSSASSVFQHRNNKGL